MNDCHVDAWGVGQINKSPRTPHSRSGSMLLIYPSDIGLTIRSDDIKAPNGMLASCIWSIGGKQNIAIICRDLVVLEEEGPAQVPDVYLARVEVPSPQNSSSVLSKTQFITCIRG